MCRTAILRPMRCTVKSIRYRQFGLRRHTTRSASKPIRKRSIRTSWPHLPPCAQLINQHCRYMKRLKKDTGASRIAGIGSRTISQSLSGNPRSLWYTIGLLKEFEQPFGMKAYLMPYATDITDTHWAELAPRLAQGAGPGRPRTVDVRQVLNALLYKNRTG